MIRTGMDKCCTWSIAVLAVIFGCSTGVALADVEAASYQGKPVHIGKGVAYTLVRTDASGVPVSIGVRFTPGMLNGLPKARKGANPDFPYVLPMPEAGPKTPINHVMINWESTGHPPAHVYDVPHFDFHFYLVSVEERMKVVFKSDTDSGNPDQQPAPEYLPAGYIVPPGTAVSQMGVHAVNPGAGEFHKQPFNATFIYGYYNKELTFLEPMASRAYLQSKPTMSAPIARPAAYAKSGAYPSAYGVRFDAKKKIYAVDLEDWR